MPRSNRLKSLLRDGRSGAGSLARRGAAWLSRMAGVAGEDPSRAMEPLEQRQLLFALAVTADDIDPATGVGTVSAYFAYGLPQLAVPQDIPDPQPGQTVNEDFNDEGIGNVGSNVRLAGSGVLVIHNITPAANFRIIGTDGQNPPQERALRVDFSNPGEFFAFRFANAQGTQIATTSVRQARFTITADPNSGSPLGLNTDETTLEIRLNGAVIGTLTGQALRNAINPGTPGQGVGTFTIDPPANFGGFDEIRIVSNTGNNPAFRFDDLAYDLPDTRFGENLSGLLRGATITVTGPVGATATIFDLYGRDMLRTLSMFPGGSSTYPDRFDTDFNGVPNFNNGIGRIVLSGFDSRSAVSMWGGDVTFSQQPPADRGDFTEPGINGGFYTFKVLDQDLVGDYDDFEQAGFGYVIGQEPGQAQPVIHGLPPGPGSVVIGSPFVRDDTNAQTYNPAGNAPGVGPIVTTGFTRPDQGIFAENGQNVGSVYIHGIVHGSSRISGYINRFYAGYLVGSLTVDGDAGQIISGTDAGEWSPDPGDPPPFNRTLEPVYKTGGQVVVGRTLGEFIAAGRNLMDVTVVGDLNSPQTRPARNIAVYNENEYVYGFNPQTTTVGTTIRATMAGTAAFADTASALFRARGQGVVLGDSYFRNDSILSAEWVGNAGSSVRIRGELSGRDNSQGEDTDDVYAFAADGTQDIVAQGTAGTPLYYRIVDQDGRTLAAPEFSLGSGRFPVSELRYRPNAPGVYYLVVTDPGGADTGFTNTSYTVSIMGMAPVAFGAYRTGGSSGFTDLTRGLSNSVTALAGAMGSVRVGTGFTDGSGGEVSPAGTINTTLDEDDVMSFQGGTLSVARTLYNITTGSDIGAPGGGGTNFVTFFIGGDLGSMVTGLSTVVGGGPNEGDVNLLNLNVAARIGAIDIRGGVGMDQDNVDPRAPVGPDVFNISTGTGGGPGDIGMVRVGFHVAGDAWNIRTSANSRIGAILVSQDVYDDADARSGVYLGQRGISIQTGPGSDVRFVDTPRIDLLNSVDVIYPIIAGQILNLVDDAGSRIAISVTNMPAGQQVGLVRALPISGSQGVAIGEIVMTALGTGASLNITSSNPGGAGTVGIGRIILADGSASSQLNITGTVEVDVYRVEAVALDSLSNTTPGGDVVAIDIGTLNTLQIASGNLGRTQVPAFGPRLIGPYLGVGVGLAGDIRGAIGFDGTIDNDFNGGVYRPLRDDSFNGGNAYLDDVGGPVDGWLNGLIVRAGGVVAVTVSGQVGDVILQAGDGVLQTLTANSDGVSGFDGFDGIVGHVFAGDINTIDVGDGLAANAQSPLATAGVFAMDDILTFVSSRASGARILGVVNANNLLNPDLDPLQVNGIQQVSLNNAIIQDAKFLSRSVDGFWVGFNYTDDNINAGDLGTISLVNSTVFRSEFGGGALRSFSLAGTFDASTIDMVLDIGTVTVTDFRNSTLGGTLFEQHENTITSGRNVQSIIATNDMADLDIDVTGSIVTGLTARNIIRTVINVDNTVQLITATGDIRSSELVSGAVPAIAATNITASNFLIAGALTSMTATNQILNSNIEVTGPDGRIDLLTAATLISGSVSASGPIVTMTVTNGDIAARITTTGPNGNVTTIQASRDVNIRTDISGTLTTLSAGRHIGSRTNPGVILVRGDLADATAASGQLYNDLRVGGTITGTVTTGAAVNKPGNDQVGRGSIVASGPINAVVANGDFGGDIISYTGNITSVAINNGSFLPGRIIAAYDGDLTSVVITNGSLFGDVHADYNLVLLRVVAGTNGVFGHLGVKPGLSQATGVDGIRNQLPAGVSQRITFQGPQISAGFNIVNVTVDGDSYESGFTAGRAINSITIGGVVRDDDVTPGIGNFFAAGDNIDNITINGFVDNTAFVAGVAHLGADNRPGGAGANADILTQGAINNVTISGGTTNTTFSAGMNPGADGVYNTGDDRVVLGRSFINNLNLGGSVINVSAFGDIISAGVNDDARIVKGGTNLPSTNPALSTGTPTGASFSGTQTFTIPGGPDVTISTAGAGQFWFDAALNRLAAHNTDASTSITVSSSTGTINAFKLYTNDDASVGTITFNTNLSGDSNILVDGDLTTLVLQSFFGSGTVLVGGNLAGATFASLGAGFLNAHTAGTVQVNGDFGMSDSAVTGEAKMDLGSAQSIAITGVDRGDINAGRDVDSITLGSAQRAKLRVGNSLVAFTSGTISQTVLSVGDRLTTVAINGDMTDSSILSGTDLGSDAFFDPPTGPTGVFQADLVTAGSIGGVTIAGNMRGSNIVAGYQRGFDNFFGSTDDTVANGRSSIGSVTIGGTVFGSTRNTESFRIAAAGSIGIVRVGGGVFSGNAGNFGVETTVLPPASIEVTDLRVNVESRVYTAVLAFNQPVDASTIVRALSVYEVRGNGGVELRLINGVDFTTAYQASTNSILVTFSRTVTERNLPVVPGTPGPGVYRFRISQAIFQAKLRGAKIDGNGDGLARAGENYSDDAIVGDAGDKLSPNSITIGSHRIDFYAPTNLDLVLDNNATPDGLPDANREITVRGFIGDHPDNDTNDFRFSGDADLYYITLQAGQILHLGAMQGPAQLASLLLLDPSGAPVATVADSAATEFLPTTPLGRIDLTSPQAYLIKQTGRYIIAVDNTGGAYADPTSVPNIDPVPGGMGDYNFTVQIFDDGDSGFTASTDAGNGRNLVNPPAPITFAGPDGQFGTADDVSSITVGAYSFSLNFGSDGAPNTADDLVSGSTPDGATSTRTGAGLTTNTVNGAIGPAGHAGRPSDIFADADVYHLNNRLPISPGTKMRITVRLSDLGSDLGSAVLDAVSDNRGSVQFGLFDTSGSTGIDDALLVFSPTDFSPNGGKPNTTIADNGATKYGYDDRGDFYIEFVTPDRIGVPGAAATFAVYIQGANNADYQLEVNTLGSGSITKTGQNVVIETNGGIVNWLRVGGLGTTITPFDARVLGFQGLLNNGQDAQTYIISRLVGGLNSLFQGAGFNVRFSTSSSDFEFEPFSTVYLSSDTDPITPIFNPFEAFNIDPTQAGLFQSAEPYGYAQHSDPFNADRSDEAVIFAPSFQLLGLTPSQADVDGFVQSMTAAVSRRVGELMGLRITSPNGTGGSRDVMGSDSVGNRPPAGSSYVISGASRSLSTPFDAVTRTDFFLGRQNSLSLLDKVLGRI